jgi:methylated-DNA-protein-cysteine methyltransferase-like protein
MSDSDERIYRLARAIPRGKVTTSGQLGAMCGITDPRIVGEAMNASHGVPWQRVINSRGEISIKGATGARQRALLGEEGIEFDANGRVDLARFGWTPDAAWLTALGYYLPPPLVKDKPASKAKEKKREDEGGQLSLF